MTDDPRAAAFEPWSDGERDQFFAFVTENALTARDTGAAAAFKQLQFLENELALLQAAPPAECEICRDCDSIKGSVATICGDHYASAIQSLADTENELAELQAAPPAEGPTWQPIASCPTGVDVALLWANFGTVQAGHLEDWCERYDADQNPTHWMPLPAPPRDPAGKE